MRGERQAEMVRGNSMCANPLIPTAHIGKCVRFERHFWKRKYFREREREKKTKCKTFTKPCGGAATPPGRRLLLLSGETARFCSGGQFIYVIIWWISRRVHAEPRGLEVKKKKCSQRNIFTLQVCLKSTRGGFTWEWGYFVSSEATLVNRLIKVCDFLFFSL